MPPSPISSHVRTHNACTHVRTYAYSYIYRDYVTQSHAQKDFPPFCSSTSPTPLSRSGGGGGSETAGGAQSGGFSRPAIHGYSREVFYPCWLGSVFTSESFSFFFFSICVLASAPVKRPSTQDNRRRMRRSLQENSSLASSLCSAPGPLGPRIMWSAFPERDEPRAGNFFCPSLSLLSSRARRVGGSFFFDLPCVSSGTWGGCLRTRVRTSRRLTK